jgi:hypothetical protein
MSDPSSMEDNCTDKTFTFYLIAGTWNLIAGDTGISRMILSTSMHNCFHEICGPPSISIQVVLHNRMNTRIFLGNDFEQY